ncbi:MAG: hypothetical protein ACSHX3_11490 [Litorimonas sp.]
MKALLTALIFGLSPPAAVMAANPLTPAEQRVCQSLNHCLQIIETHPQDSFDYAALAEDFHRFGPKGRDALIRRIAKGGKSAGHAADLLALTGDASALPRLRKRQADASHSETALIRRTVVALQARLNATPSDPLPPPSERTATDAAICSEGIARPFEARRREMPFFELNVATPDRVGAYRPSATFTMPLRFASRGWLRTARPVPGGWLAGYPDGLVAYDSRTGAPTLRLKGHVLSVQARDETSMTPESWVFILNDQNQTHIFDVGPKALRLTTTLRGPLAELRRGPDGALYASSATGHSVTMRPDGSIKLGCGDVQP